MARAVQRMFFDGPLEQAERAAVQLAELVSPERQALLTFLPFLFVLIALSILMTWVFNHTGSVPLMVVMHASLDTTTNLVSPPHKTVLLASTTPH